MECLSGCGCLRTSARNGELRWRERDEQAEGVMQLDGEVAVVEVQPRGGKQSCCAC